MFLEALMFLLDCTRSGCQGPPHEVRRMGGWPHASRLHTSHPQTTLPTAVSVHHRRSKCADMLLKQSNISACRDDVGNATMSSSTTGPDAFGGV